MKNLFLFVLISLFFSSLGWSFSSQERIAASSNNFEIKFNHFGDESTICVRGQAKKGDQVVSGFCIPKVDVSTAFKMAEQRKVYNRLFAYYRSDIDMIDLVNENPTVLGRPLDSKGQRNLTSTDFKNLMLALDRQSPGLKALSSSYANAKAAESKLITCEDKLNKLTAGETSGRPVAR